MKMKHLTIYVLMLGTLTRQAAYTQEIRHSDVSFVYGETKIEINLQDGRLAIPQVMPQDGFFAQANVNPGFFSERDTGGGTEPSDLVGYNVLDDLVFWREGDFAAPKTDTQIRIINNPRNLVPDTFVGTGTGEQRAAFDPLENSIGQSSSSGDFHSHVDFRLEPVSSEPDESPLPGAYGLKLSLSSDNPAIQESDPFFIVYRFGIDEEQFSLALHDFDALLALASSTLGDFNSDGLLTVEDIDLLSEAVAANANQASFDLTEDGFVDEADRKTWIAELAETYSGDTNLDGNVDFSDFLVLSSSFGMPGGWAEGDFDGNGDVQFPDFLALASNFGKEATGAVSIPEPATDVLAYAMLLATLLMRRRSGIGNPWENSR